LFIKVVEDQLYLLVEIFQLVASAAVYSLRLPSASSIFSSEAIEILLALEVRCLFWSIRIIFLTC